MSDPNPPMAVVLPVWSTVDGRYVVHGYMAAEVHRSSRWGASSFKSSALLKTQEEAEKVAAEWRADWSKIAQEKQAKARARMGKLAEKAKKKARKK